MSMSPCGAGNAIIQIQQLTLGKIGARIKKRAVNPGQNLVSKFYKLLMNQMTGSLY